MCVVVGGGCLTTCVVMGAMLLCVVVGGGCLTLLVLLWLVGVSLYVYCCGWWVPHYVCCCGL